MGVQQMRASPMVTHHQSGRPLLDDLAGRSGMEQHGWIRSSVFYPSAASLTALPMYPAAFCPYCCLQTTMHEYS
jgi:hypothetical protein